MDNDMRRQRAQEFIEPLDTSPFTPPNGWCGGAVEHTGGNIFCRQWMTQNATLDTAQPGDTAYEVVYNGVDPRVALQQMVYDEQYESFVVEEMAYVVQAGAEADASMERQRRGKDD